MNTNTTTNHQVDGDNAAEVLEATKRALAELHDLKAEDITGIVCMVGLKNGQGKGVILGSGAHAMMLLQHLTTSVFKNVPEMGQMLEGLAKALAEGDNSDDIPTPTSEALH